MVNTKLTGVKLDLSGTDITEVPEEAFCEGSMENFQNAVACTSIKEVVLPETVTVIGNGAFSKCSELTNINIPNGVAKIGSGSFSSCPNLTSIELPDGVESIEPFAFNSSGLKSLTIPASVTYIGVAAFWGCKDLKSVVFEDTDYKWEPYYRDKRQTPIAVDYESTNAERLRNSMSGDNFYKSDIPAKKAKKAKK